MHPASTTSIAAIDSLLMSAAGVVDPDVPCIETVEEAQVFSGGLDEFSLRGFLPIQYGPSVVGKPAQVLARIRRASDGAYAEARDVEAISYQVLHPDLVVTGPFSIATTAVLDEVILKPKWRRDRKGFNFQATFPGTTFTQVGTHVIQIDFTFLGGEQGQSIVIEVEVYDPLSGN